MLARGGLPHRLVDFYPYGYDERQYNSPGFRMAVGSLMRGRHGQFPEYHTSADNLGFVTPDRMAEALRACQGIVAVLDGNATYRNLAPHGEPQLGKRGLYRSVGGTGSADVPLALLWLLSLSDGASQLLDVAERAGIPFDTIRLAADLLLQHGLLSEVARAGEGPSS